MHWKLYRKDDPNTWPEIDCPMFTCRYFWDNFYELKIMYWDQDENSFYYVENMTKFYCIEDELYYQYIGYIPSGYKTIKTKKCQYTDEHGERYSCPYGLEDDGYCFDIAEGTDCMFCKEVIEYSINDNKIIWKEFA